MCPDIQSAISPIKMYQYFTSLKQSAHLRQQCREDQVIGWLEDSASGVKMGTVSVALQPMLQNCLMQSSGLHTHLRTRRHLVIFSGSSSFASCRDSRLL